MAITDEQQLDIINVCGGFFNAAPGQTFLNEFIATIEAGATIEQLADAFASSSVFTDTILGGQTSTSAIVNVLMNNYGLTSGNSDPDSADAQAEAFFTARLDSGASVSSIIIEATNYLNGTVDSAFVETQNLYINKGLVAQAYSASKFSSDVSVLQGVYDGLTGTSILTQDEIDAIVEEAEGDITISYTLSTDASSSGLAEGVAATFTLTASAPVEEDTVVTFSVVPSDTSAADQGTNSTNVNDFPSGTFNPQTATILAGETTASFFMSGQADGITELPETFSVQAEIGEETWLSEVSLVDGGATSTLTTGQDNVLGSLGNDTIIGLVGTGATFTLGDNINGDDGDDTLSLTTDNATVNVSNATISNVENLVVNSRTIGPTAATTLDVGGYLFDSVTSQGVAGVDTGADTFAISDIETSTDVTLEDIADVATTITYNSVTGNSDSANVTIKGAVEDATTAGENDLTVAGIETFNLMFANGNTNTIVNDVDVISAAQATTANITVNSDSMTMVRGAAALGSATAVNIAAASNLTLQATAALANDAVITVTGEGDVDLNTLDDNGATNGVTVNATGMTGGLTATTGANTVAVNTGSGDDAITMGATVTTAVATGEGDDTVNLGANDQGSATTNATIDGGDGTDVLGITVAANFDAGTLANAVNFETLGLGGAAAGTYSMKDKGFSGVLLNANTAADGVIVSGITNETISFADTGNADVTLVNNNVTFALDDATGTSDTLAIDITGAQSTAVFGHPGGAGTLVTTDDTNDITLDEIVVADVETVTLSSNTHADNVAGTANVLGSISTDAAALNVTGNHALSILTFDTEAAGTDVSNVSLTSIDASASGGLIMGEEASTQTISILGSEFADTLVVNTAGSTINAGAGSDSITTAAGASDTLIINAGDSQIGFTDANTSGGYNEGEELHDTVVGFVTTEDTIDLGSFGFTGQQASALAGPSLTPAAALQLIDGTTTSIADFFVDTGVQRGVSVVSGDFDNIDGTATADDATNDTLVFIDTNGDGNLDVGIDDMIELTGTAAVALADFGF